MSAIKDGRMPVELNGNTYYLLFSLNALDEMQDRFGGYDKLDKAFDQSNPTMIKDLRWLLTLIINEGMEEGETPLTEQQVGKLIHICITRKARRGKRHLTRLLSYSAITRSITRTFSGRKAAAHQHRQQRAWTT